MTTVGAQIRWMKLALKVAEDAQHKRHHMGAVIVRGGCVLSKAFNISRPLDSANRGHAEVRAICNRDDLAGATIYIARSNCRISRPCRACFEAIRKAGIRKIVFIDQGGRVVEERVVAERMD